MQIHKNIMNGQIKTEMPELQYKNTGTWSVKSRLRGAVHLLKILKRTCKNYLNQGILLFTQIISFNLPLSFIMQIQDKMLEIQINTTL